MMKKSQTLHEKIRPGPGRRVHHPTSSTSVDDGARPRNQHTTRVCQIDRSDQKDQGFWADFEATGGVISFDFLKFNEKCDFLTILILTEKAKTNLCIVLKKF